MKKLKNMKFVFMKLKVMRVFRCKYRGNEKKRRFVGLEWEKNGWKLNSRALRAQKWWFMMVGKIDDNGVIVNKKKWCGCIWFFSEFRN